jgi:carboxylesterase type B
MINFLSLLSIALVAGSGRVVGQTLPTVTLEYSTIRANSYNATGDFYVYKNIRFAAPPVGSLRFQEPQPPLPETAVNDGSDRGACGTQEDCLFLDVYVPASAQAGSNLSVVL